METVQDLRLARTDEERLAAFRKTQERMRLPEGYDAEAVVLGALRRARTKDQLSVASEQETAKIAHLTAQRLQRSDRNFLSDVFAAAGPILVVAVMALGVTWIGGQRLTSSLTEIAWSESVTRIGTPVIFLTLCTVTVALGLTRFLRGSGRWAALARSSGGALLVGLSLIPMIGWMTIQEKTDVESQTGVSLALTEKEVGDFMLDYYRSEVASGIAPNCNREVGLVKISASDDQQECAASMETLPGIMLAKFGTQEGELVWKNGALEEVRAKILLGRISEITANGFVLQRANGATHNLAVLDSWHAAKLGEYVGVITDEQERLVTRIEPLN